MLHFKHLNLVFRYIGAVNLLVIFTFTNGCSAPNKAQEINSVNSNISNEEISLFDGRVSFVPPPDFKTLAIDKLNKKLADNDSPKHIFSNSDQTGVVLIYFEDFDLKPEDLPEAKKFVEGIHRNYSGWIVSEIREMNGRQWFQFEWEEKPNERELVAPISPDDESPTPTPNKTLSHYQEFTTSLNNKNLRFVFLSDVKEFPKLKDAFNKSIGTIKVKK